MTGQRLNWRDPVIFVIGCAFVMECGMNALGAYDFLGGADGGFKAVLIAFSGALVAFLGAWSGHEGAAKGMRDGWGFWPILMMTVATLVFLLSQFAGWRVVGVSLADGGLKREIAAGDLESWRNERRGLGTPRPIAAIQNDISLELRATSKAFPNGDGPRALKLKNELAAAERAADLENRIAGAGKGGFKQAGAENAIAQRVVGWDKETSQLVLVVALVGLIGFFANFGLALVHVVRGVPGGGGGGGSHYRRQPDETWQDYGHRVGEATSRTLDAAPRHLMLPAPAAGHASGSAPQSGGSHQGVTINISPSGVSAPGMLQGAPQALSTAAGGAPGSEPGAPRYARRDLPALPADAPPIDRSRIVRQLSDDERPAADVILAFRAACVIDAPGGLVSVENLHRRYAHWAGERALDLKAFLRLFADVTGVRIADVTGFPHAHDVALRVGASLKVA
jgi:hypothetical protein